MRLVGLYVFEMKREETHVRSEIELTVLARCLSIHPRTGRRSRVRWGEGEWWVDAQSECAPTLRSEDGSVLKIDFATNERVSTGLRRRAGRGAGRDG